MTKYVMINHLKPETFERMIIFIQIDEIICVREVTFNNQKFNNFELRKGGLIMGNIMQEVGMEEIVNHYKESHKSINNKLFICNIGTHK